MVWSGVCGPTQRAACAPLSRQQLPPLHLTMQQAPVTSLWCDAKLQEPRDACGCGRSGLTCIGKSRACAPCCLLVSPLLYPRGRLQSFCLCVCGCSEPVNAAWGLRDLNTQSLLACSCISIAHLLIWCPKPLSLLMS